MGVPTSEVGYTIATTRRENHEVPPNMWWGGKKKTPYIYSFHLSVIPFIQLGN